MHCISTAYKDPPEVEIYSLPLYARTHCAYLESKENKAFLETMLSPPRITAPSADMIIPRGEVCLHHVGYEVAGESKLPLHL